MNTTWINMESESSCVKLLFENPADEALSAADVLLKIANNILNNPDNQKYRTLKVANAIVSSKLLPVSGAMECLFEMGFEEETESLVLPQGAACLQKLRTVRDKIEAGKRKMQGKNNSTTQAGAAASAPVVASSSATPATQTSSQLQAAAAATSHPYFTLQQQMGFYSKLTAQMEHVMLYEDPNLQTKARRCIPMEELDRKAQSKLDNIKKQNNSTADVDKQDLFLLELLAWFKKDFFKWVDAPKCDACGGNTRSVGMATPTPAEQNYGAGRVENYLCDNCNQHTRFPRYNHPGKLLDTRRGRCGEWANCFTLCCRAVGLEARYVLDWTDHVWTEVYSLAQKRWLHCDPCENKCDKPLIYEAGWGKKLSYIIAFAKDDVQDVTWRYSSKHKEVLSRRRECNEQWLVDTIVRLRTKKQSHLGEERRKVLRDRTVRELVELMSPRTAGEGEGTGRESGSQAWRLARGETGKPAQKAQPTMIKPTKTEIDNLCVHLKYCCATDEYLRVSDGGHVTKRWDAMVSDVSQVQRKEEHDWKMVYLAREEGSSEASVSWKFDFTDSGVVVDKVDVAGLCRRYENGQVMWRVCGDATCSFLPADGVMTHISDLSGSKTLTLTAHMRGGKGDVAWQHTQLFRQEMSETKLYPLDIKITLKKR